jgi:[ribosomal protein S5]-alanine N-acetyltransferase
MSDIDLRPVRRADADDLIAANRASFDHHHPWVEPFTDQDGFETWFDDIAGGARVSLIARDRSAGGVVGVLNLSQIFGKGFQNAYLGFYGMVGFEGRGLMTQALRLAVAYAFAEIGLHRLEANVQPENARSLALVRRVGFRKEGFSPRYLRIGGVWRDHERWAILADEFEA